MKERNKERTTKKGRIRNAVKKKEGNFAEGRVSKEGL